MATKPRIVASIPNCNALYKKELWKKNRQDESLIVGQDGEFNYRLSQQGIRFLVIPEAVVWHHRTSTVKGFARRMFRYGEATAKIFLKHPGILRTRWYALLSHSNHGIWPCLMVFTLLPQVSASADRTIKITEFLRHD